MQITLTAETILKILKIHYKKNEDFTGDIKINKSIGEESHYGEVYDVANISFTMNGVMEYIGEEVPYSRNVSKEEANEIIRELLEANGFKIQNLTYDTEIESKSFPAEIYDNTEKTIKFAGIKCEVKKIDKKNIKK